MHPIVFLLDTILYLYNMVLIVWVIVSWLIQFRIINAYQPLVAALNRFLYQLTEPALKVIRRHVPLLNGIDLSPIILILVIIFLRYTLGYYFG